MTIFEIDRQILDLFEKSIDPETGELILNEEELNKLQMDKDKKIENLLMLYKDILAQAKAIKDEIDALNNRYKPLVNHAERLKAYAGTVLNGERFETSKVKALFKESKAVSIDDSFIEWAKKNRDDLLRFKEPEVDKVKVKEAILNGEKIEGASLETRKSIQIK